MILRFLYPFYDPLTPETDWYINSEAFLYL